MLFTSQTIEGVRGMGKDLKTIEVAGMKVGVVSSVLACRTLMAFWAQRVAEVKVVVWEF